MIDVADDMLDRVAAEMRRQCGKSTDKPWETLSALAKKRWRKRARAVLAVIPGRYISPDDFSRLLVPR